MSDEPQHPTVLDSDQQQIGSLYAKALLAAAGDSADTIVAELESIVTECLDQNVQLEEALASPRMSQETKEGMLDRIFSGRIDAKLLSFLKVLCRRARIDSLRAIQVTASIMREEQLGKMRVQVTSAHKLSESQLADISAKLSQVYGKQVIVIESVDEKLLGGIVIRIGDRVLDGSVVGKLDALRFSVTAGVNRAIRDRFDSLLST